MDKTIQPAASPLTRIAEPGADARPKAMPSATQESRSRVSHSSGSIEFAAEQHAVVDRLIEIGKRRLLSPRAPVDFETGSPESEAMLNDIEHYPHLFVLACIMDRQITPG